MTFQCLENSVLCCNQRSGVVVAYVNIQFQPRDVRQLRDPHIEAGKFVGTGENLVLGWLASHTVNL